MAAGQTNGATTRKLYKKLVAVQAAAKQVDKTGHMKAHNYDFMQEHGLLGLLGPLWEEHNLFVAGSVAPGTVEHVGNKCYLEWELVVLDGESGEQMVFRGAGEGQDQGDKGTAKAMTMANKYCLQKVFQIATEKIDDADNTSSAQLAEEAAAAEKQGEPKDAAPQPKTGPRAKPSARKLKALRDTAKAAVEAKHINAQRVQAALQGTYAVDKIDELPSNEAADSFASWLEEELTISAEAKG